VETLANPGPPGKWPLKWRETLHDPHWFYNNMASMSTVVLCNVSNVLSPPNVLKVEWTLTAVSCLMYHCCVYKYSEKNQIASQSRLLHICTWTNLPRACWGSTYGWCGKVSRSSSEQDTKRYRHASWRVCITFSLRLQRTKVSVSAAS